LSNDLNQQIIYGSACTSKVNIEIAHRRKEKLFREHEATIIGEARARDPLKIIEHAAKEGRWVAIMSVRFPRYWLKVDEML
jgi:hypothetical protein